MEVIMKDPNCMHSPIDSLKYIKGSIKEELNKKSIELIIKEQNEKIERLDQLMDCFKSIKEENEKLKIEKNLKEHIKILRSYLNSLEIRYEIIPEKEKFAINLKEKVYIELKNRLKKMNLSLSGLEEIKNYNVRENPIILRDKINDISVNYNKELNKKIILDNEKMELSVLSVIKLIFLNISFYIIYFFESFLVSNWIYRFIFFILLCGYPYLLIGRTHMTYFFKNANNLSKKEKFILIFMLEWFIFLIDMLHNFKKFSFFPVYFNSLIMSLTIIFAIAYYMDIQVYSNLIDSSKLIFFINIMFLFSYLGGDYLSIELLFDVVLLAIIIYFYFLFCDYFNIKIRKYVIFFQLFTYLYLSFIYYNWDLFWGYNLIFFVNVFMILFSKIFPGL